MMVLRTSTFAEDQDGNSVLLAAGDSVDEISDAGPWSTDSGFDNPVPTGWNVIVKFTPKNRQWTELLTIDAVTLLKALNGQASAS